jgi:hypothetical protein
LVVSTPSFLDSLASSFSCAGLRRIALIFFMVPESVSDSLYASCAYSRQQFTQNLHNRKERKVTR